MKYQGQRTDWCRLFHQCCSVTQTSPDTHPCGISSPALYLARELSQSLGISKCIASRYLISCSCAGVLPFRDTVATLRGSSAQTSPLKEEACWGEKAPVEPSPKLCLSWMPSHEIVHVHPARKVISQPRKSQQMINCFFKHEGLRQLPTQQKVAETGLCNGNRRS